MHIGDTCWPVPAESAEWQGGETFLAADGEKRRFLDIPSTSWQGCVILTVAQTFKSTWSYWIHMKQLQTLSAVLTCPR